MKKDKIAVFGAVALIIVLLVVVTIQFQKQEPPKTTDNNQTVTSLQPPEMTIDTKKAYLALLKTTKGEIAVELNSKQTPKTANNFIYLAKKSFYDNTIFHRVMKGFMIQGGDPKGDGTGGPGYKFDDEKFEGEYTRGTVAMANAGPNTNGSQFFILQKDSPLQKDYVIFGKVIKGMDVVDSIADASVKANAMGKQEVPVDPVKILSVKIEEK